MRVGPTSLAFIVLAAGLMACRPAVSGKPSVKPNDEFGLGDCARLIDDNFPGVPIAAARERVRKGQKSLYAVTSTDYGIEILWGLNSPEHPELSPAVKRSVVKHGIFYARESDTCPSVDILYRRVLPVYNREIFRLVG